MTQEIIMNKIKANAMKLMWQDIAQHADDEADAKEWYEEDSNNALEVNRYTVKAMYQATHFTRQSNLPEATKETIIEAIKSSDEYKAHEAQVISTIGNAIIKQARREA